jgi:hypothetical protein
MPGMTPNEDLDPERQETILALLRERSKSASLSALRQQLLQDGYDPATVDRAIAVYQEQNPPKPPASVWPKVLLVVAFNAVILALIGWASRGGEYGFIPAVVVYGFLICCVELVVFFSLRATLETRHWGRALLRGLALFVGLAIIVLGGLCFAGP